MRLQSLCSFLPAPMVAGDTVMLSIPTAIPVLAHKLRLSWLSSEAGYANPVPTAYHQPSIVFWSPWSVGGFQDGEFSPGSSILPPNTIRYRCLYRFHRRQKS